MEKGIELDEGLGGRFGNGDVGLCDNVCCKMLHKKFNDTYMDILFESRSKFWENEVEIYGAH